MVTKSANPRASGGKMMINLTVCIRALSPKPATTLDLVEQAWPSIHSTAGTLTSGTSGPRWFSLILPHERIRRRIRLCHFSTLIGIVAETAVVSSGTLPVELPLPTISKNSLYTLFYPMILDQGVSFIISISGSKILIFLCVARYFFSPSFSICDNQTLVFLICTILPRCYQVGFSS